MAHRIRRAARAIARRAMSPKAVAPVEINRGATWIGGGFLGSQHWIIATETMNDREFIVLDRQDRYLAKFLGYNLTSGNPMAGNVTRWYVQLQALRDLEVDRVISTNRPQDIIAISCVCRFLRGPRSRGWWESEGDLQKYARGGGREL